MADFTVFMKGCLEKNKEDINKGAKISTVVSSYDNEVFCCLSFNSIEDVGITLHSITIEDLKVLRGVIDNFLKENE